MCKKAGGGSSSGRPSPRLPNSAHPCSLPLLEESKPTFPLGPSLANTSSAQALRQQGREAAGDLVVLVLSCRRGHASRSWGLPEVTAGLHLDECHSEHRGSRFTVGTGETTHMRPLGSGPLVMEEQLASGQTADSSL